METYILEIGWMIKHKERGNIFIQMVLLMKGIGILINNMGLARSFGLMELCMWEITSLE
jgi:hypothetical protein